MSRGPRVSKPRRRAAFLSPLLLLGFGPLSLWAQSPAPAPEADLSRAVVSEVGRVFASCGKAVVRIQATDRFGPHVGTGFFVDPKGTIYTHYSVGGDSWDLTVEFADKKYPAKCLVADPRSGLAMLKIEADTPFLPIGRSDALEPTEPVMIIGYPWDFPASSSYGPLVGFDQKALGGYLLPAHIRAQVIVHPGEQGAPLLNLRGEVVGIVVGRLGQSMACYALPVKAAEKIRRDFVRFGEPRPGFLGVDISPSPEFVNDQNIETRVAELTPDSPAVLGGLRKGDVLLQVGDIPIRRPSDVLDVAFYLTGGDEVPVTVLRDGEKISLRVEAADEPNSARALAKRRAKTPTPEQSAQLTLEKSR